VLHDAQAVDEVFSSCTKRAFRPNVAFLFATDNLLLSREEDEPDASALLQAALRKYATARVGRGPGTHTHAGWTHARTHAQGPDGEIIAQRARVNAGIGVRARAGSCGLVRARAWQAQ
jgi:hypothetical protein